MSFALPFLQLDVSNGVYDDATETVFATDNVFTLKALVNPKNAAFSFDQTYYISAAISPQVTQGADLGVFKVNDQTIRATEDMIYGTAPIDILTKHQDLPGHGIFPTYFTEFAFALDPTQTTAAYNSQDDPGGVTDADVSITLYYLNLTTDITGLAEDYSIHFDLYTKNEDGSIAKFAPFSHDAQSSPVEWSVPVVENGFATVPEPKALLLLGCGLSWILCFSRNLNRGQISGKE